jgi:hypothetical protein
VVGQPLIERTHKALVDAYREPQFEAGPTRYVRTRLAPVGTREADRRYGYLPDGAPWLHGLRPDAHRDGLDLATSQDVAGESLWDKVSQVYWCTCTDAEVAT